MRLPVPSIFTISPVSARPLADSRKISVVRQSRAVESGTPVYAAAMGTVEIAGWNGGYGQFVKIRHGNGYESAYGHMSGIAVTTGQQVRKGEIIGFVGSTGYSTGPHLHFEVFVDGENIDPLYMLKRAK